MYTKILSTLTTTKLLKLFSIVLAYNQYLGKKVL